MSLLMGITIRTFMIIAGLQPINQPNTHQPKLTISRIRNKRMISLLRMDRTSGFKIFKLGILRKKSNLYQCFEYIFQLKGHIVCLPIRVLHLKLLAVLSLAVSIIMYIPCRQYIQWALK